MANMNRCVMEVLKWVDPKTVLSHAAGVSILWARVTDSDELWTAHIEAGGLEGLANHLKPMKTRYRTAVEHADADRFILMDNTVRVFQCTTNAFLTEFRTSQPIIDRRSAIVILSSKDAFVCGGGTHSAYLLSILNGTVTPVPSMLEERSFHGALCCYRKVYVFGSCYKPVWRTAECFGLREEQWRRLPKMLSRRGCFNPCYRDKKIYLCGGCTTACEVLDVLTLQYTILRFPLPTNYWTVSFFYQNQLVAIVNKILYFLENTEWKDVKIAMKYVAYESSSAVVHGHFVYIPMHSVILQINLNTRVGVSLEAGKTTHSS